MKHILFVVPYPLHRAPSQRFRIELYEPVLKENNISYDIRPFMDEETWKVLYREGSMSKKLTGVLSSYGKRFLLLFSLSRYRYVFIHREAAPLGPPVFEWIAAKVLGKKMIYDFDDAIWIPNTSKENKIAAWFKAFWKVKYVCKWSYKITAGNEYLCRFAKQYNANALLLPTCVDTKNGHYKQKIHGSHKPVVGWTGSHSTLFYLNELIPLIKELQQETTFDFLVIADKKPELDIAHWQFIKWNEATEQEDLLNMDIGVMPLKPDAWSEGKCGFKLIQYMSLGIPAVADPIGVNKEIIDNGVNGFLCNTKDEWKASIRSLLQDVEMRKRMGVEGRKKIVNEYSIESQKQKFLSLFTS